MDELRTLGIDIPTPAYLLGLLVFGIVGWIAFRRGRKTHKKSLVWVGVATMLYPYVVSETWLLWLVGAVATGWIWYDWQ